LNDCSVSGYGLGWAINGKAPHRHVHHTGRNSTGFSSHISYYVDADLAVIVLANGDHAEVDAMASAIAKLQRTALSAPGNPQDQTGT
jgi:CubicO group peptidase (beta-lactamase class C family)